MGSSGDGRWHKRDAGDTRARRLARQAMEAALDDMEARQDGYAQLAFHGGYAPDWTWSNVSLSSFFSTWPQELRVARGLGQSDYNHELNVGVVTAQPVWYKRVQLTAMAF